MDADTYQRLAARTLIDEPDTTFTNEELAIMLAALELGAAAGKVLEMVKKGICHRHGLDLIDLRSALDAVTDAATYMPYQTSDHHQHHLSGNDQMLIWCALGLGGEAGEVMDTISLLSDSVISHDVLVKEQGDVAWYLAGIATLMGVPMSHVMQANIDKLARRYENGYSSEASKLRVDAGDSNV